MFNNESIREQLIKEIAAIIDASIKTDDWAFSEDFEVVAKRILNHIEARGGELR